MLVSFQVPRRGRRPVLAVLLFALVCLASGCRDPQPAAKPVKKEKQEVVAERTPPAKPSPGPSAISGTDENGASPPSGNSPPRVVQIAFSPELIVPDAVLRAEVETEDPDQDPVTLEYEWRVNGEPDTRTEMEEFDTTGLVKGDLVTVAVTPFDGEAKGNSVLSAPVVIQNRPPDILSFPPPGMTDGRFVYQVKAEDPDGDPLSYELEEAPPGMEINPETGLIDWTIPEEAAGTYAPRILVSDGDAKAFQVFSLTVTREPRG